MRRASTTACVSKTKGGKREAKGCAAGDDVRTLAMQFQCSYTFFERAPETQPDPCTPDTDGVGTGSGVLIGGWRSSTLLLPPARSAPCNPSFSFVPLFVGRSTGSLLSPPSFPRWPVSFVINLAGDVGPRQPPTQPEISLQTIRRNARRSNAARLFPSAKYVAGC